MLIIRNAKSDELDEIYAIEAECYTEAEAAAKDAMGQRIKINNETFLVAELGGKIVGHINGPAVESGYVVDDLYKETLPSIKTGGVQTVLGLAVCPDYRRHGIAGKMLNELANIARANNRKYITLSCKDELIKYYEKQGYTKVGKSDSCLGGEVWYDMNMYL